LQSSKLVIDLRPIEPHEQLTGTNQISLLDAKFHHYTAVQVLNDVRFGLCRHRRRRKHGTVVRCDRSPSTESPDEKADENCCAPQILGYLLI
jgi:hypothetical protein